MRLPKYNLAFKRALSSANSKDDLRNIGISDELILLYDSKENILKIIKGETIIPIMLFWIKWGDTVECNGFVYGNDETGSYKNYTLIFHFAD